MAKKNQTVLPHVDESFIENVMGWKLPKTFEVRGAKGKGGSSGGNEAANTLRSDSVVKVQEVISEGPILGLTTNDAQSIFLDGTPLQNSDGTVNYYNFSWDFRTGTASQSAMSGFPDVENSITVNVNLTYEVSLTRTVSSGSIDAARVTLAFPNGLYTTNTSNGDISGNTVTYSIDTKLTAGSAWTTVANLSKSGKVMSAYEWDVLIPRPPGTTTQWDIRVRRTKADETSATTVSTINWAAYTEIQDLTESYPYTSVIGLAIDAQSTNGTIPVRSYLVDGLLIQYPTNYTPRHWNSTTSVWVPAAYSGTWNGTFTTGWCNNPAWILYDLLTNVRYGMGEFITPQMIDIYSFYSAAVYNDTLVNDYNGGTEPLYQFNNVISSQDDALKVLNAVAGSMASVLVVQGGKIHISQDRPASPVKLITKSNIKDGKFTRSSADLTTRYTACDVIWNDPSLQYLQNTVHFESTGNAGIIQELGFDGIAAYGYNSQQIAGYGVTTYGQAMRLAMYTVYTSLVTPNLLSWTASYNQMDLSVGDVVTVYDEDYANQTGAGKVSAFNNYVITLDRAVVLNSSNSITYLAADGYTLVTASILQSNTTTNTISITNNGFPLTPGFDYVITSAISPQTFRIMSIKQGDTPNAVDIVASQYDANKYLFVTGQALQPSGQFSVPSLSTMSTPTGITFTPQQVNDPVQGTYANIFVQWADQSNQTGFYNYVYQWQLNSGNWSTPAYTSVPSFTIPHAVQGTYEVQLRCVNLAGTSSPSAVTSYVFGYAGVNTLLPPTSITLQSGHGTGQNWTGNDLYIQWAANPNNVGQLNQTVGGYHIRVINNDTATTLGDYTVPATQTTFAYMYADNVLQSKPNAPSRNLLIEVWTIDAFGNNSSSYLGALFHHPAPATPSMSLQGDGNGGCLIDFTSPGDTSNIAGYLGYWSTSSSLTTANGTAFNAPATQIGSGINSPTVVLPPYIDLSLPMPQESNGSLYGETFYFIGAAYDTFSADPSSLNFTGVTSVNLGPQYVAAQNLVNGAVTAAALAADAVTAAALNIPAIDANGNLAASSVGNAQLAANAVTANKTSIAAINASTGNLSANSVNTLQIASGAVTNAQLAANAVTSSNIAANTITATNIAANAITSAAIASGAVTNLQLAANAVQSANIAASAVTSSQIAANAVTAAKTSIAAIDPSSGNLVANSVSATQIVAGSITSTQIAANTITAANILANTITAGQIAANTITASQIAAGTITAAQIASGSITTSKLVVTDLTNMIPNADFTQGTGGMDGWSYNTGAASFVQSATGVPASCPGGSGVMITASATTEIYATMPNSSAVPCSVGDVFALSCQIALKSGTVGSFTMQAIFLDKTKTYLNWYGMTITPGSVTTGAWTSESAQTTAPANAAYVLFKVSVPSATSANAIWYATNIQARKANNANMYVDGTINATKLVAGSITTTQLAANSVTSNQIAANTIVSGDIAANTITGGNIAAGTITADNILANTITAGQIAAGTITATQIASQTITATQIAGGTITGTQIAANTITGGNILAGTITADKLLVGDLTNQVTNGQFTGSTLTNWSLKSGSGTWSLDTASHGVGSSANSLKFVGPGGTTAGVSIYMNSQVVSVAQNDIYSIVLQANPTVTETKTITTPVIIATSTTGTVTVVTPTTQYLVGGTIPTGLAANATSTTGYNQLSWQYVVPATTASIQAGVQVAYNQGGVASTATVYIDNVQLIRVSGATLIQPGSITTGQIAAATITGSNIAAGTITGSLIQAGTIAAGNLATGSAIITGTAQIANGIIVDAHIQTLNGSKIIAGTITAGQIAAGTIDASKLAVTSLQAVTANTGSLNVTGLLSVGQPAANGDVWGIIASSGKTWWSSNQEGFILAHDNNRSPGGTTYTFLEICGPNSSVRYLRTWKADDNSFGFDLNTDQVRITQSQMFISTSNVLIDSINGQFAWYGPNFNIDSRNGSAYFGGTLAANIVSTNAIVGASVTRQWSGAAGHATSTQGTTLSYNAAPYGGNSSIIIIFGGAVGGWNSGDRGDGSMIQANLSLLTSAYGGKSILGGGGLYCTGMYSFTATGSFAFRVDGSIGNWDFAIFEGMR